jgi:predicted AAA+ superfamily ATPase
VSDEVLGSIREAWEQRKPVDEVVHASMMRVVSLYLLVGGMPAAVQTYIDTNDMQAVRGKQEEILKLYHWDIAQYDQDNKLYLDEIFDLIPTELNAKNKRFILKDLNEHRMFARHENGFIWLKDAGVALPTYNVEEPRVPLKLSELRNLFKLFQNDVGLLAAQYAQEIAMQILTGDVNINYGAIYENFVAQELQAHGWALRYFNSKKQGEVDFVIEQGTKVLPIEVKSGKDYQRHSALTNLLTNKEYGITEALVLNNENMKQKENVLYAPIYMTMFVQKKRVVGESKYVLDMEGLR